MNETTATKVWGYVVAFFAPVGSLISPRTVWLSVALIALGLTIGWKDIRLFGLSAIWAVVGIVVAYHARKWLIPDVKMQDYYDQVLGKAATDTEPRIDGGNLAAAVVVLAVHLVQCACILIVALSALKAGV